MKKVSWFWVVILTLHVLIIFAPLVLSEPNPGAGYMLRPFSWLRTAFLVVATVPVFGLAFSRRIFQPQYWAAFFGVEVAAFLAATALNGLGLSGSWAPVVNYVVAVVFTTQVIVFYGHYLYAFKSRHIWIQA